MKATYAPYLFWLASMAAGLSAWSAHATEGRIVFSGAVVEPTCPLDAAAVSAGPAPTATARHTCGGRPGDPGRSYTRTVVNLDASLAAGDRLLGYFASYGTVPGDASATRAQLVVRTYD